MVNGTIVNYYLHCKRQCWLFYNKVNLEDNSEDVHIGRILHELKNDDKQSEIAIDNIKVDKITNEYVVEIKKSDADMEAATTQLEYYLYVLRKKGIERKGKLQIIEKNVTDHKIHVIEYSSSMEQKMESLIREIETFLDEEIPPEAVLKKRCKRCAYYEYCFI